MDVKKNHCFTVDADRDSNKLWVSEFHGSPEVEQRLVKPPFRADDGWYHNVPETLQAPGLPDIKWNELYKNWRKFVPAELWPTWKYYDEDLPEDKKKNLKAASNKTKKARGDRARTVVPQEATKAGENSSTAIV